MAGQLLDARTLFAEAFPPSDAPEEWRGDHRSSSGRSFRLLAIRQPNYRIEAAMDRTAEMEMLEEYRKHLWVVLSIALVACAAAGYWIARRGLRPLQDVTATASLIRPNNLGERITDDHLPSELHELAATFNAMLDRLEQSFARQSRFSADVAHELRTPVDNLRGGVEVALSRPRSPEEYRDVLGSTLEECARLARLIDSLLFLARAENPRTQVDREPLDLGIELAAVSEFYDAAAAEAGVRLHVAASGPTPASVNRPLFQRAIGNLIANALDHVPAGGAITLLATSDDTSTVVEVSDTGGGIAPEHLPHVFDRFYRADAVRESAGNHLGLGLALVRSIAELHDGTVAIASEVGRGTRVMLTLPKADRT
jgi:two-component system heavy metal sensor histidine kinase CusS